MNSVPVPVVFEPIFKPKPWGGRKLAELFAKRLPGDQPIGESWELAQLPGDESGLVRALTKRVIAVCDGHYGPPAHATVG